MSDPKKNTKKEKSKEKNTAEKKELTPAMIKKAKRRAEGTDHCQAGRDSSAA